MAKFFGRYTFLLGMLTVGCDAFANDTTDIPSTYKTTAILEGGIKLELAMNIEEVMPIYLNRYKLQIDQLLQTHDNVHYTVEPTEQLNTIKLLFEDEKSLEISKKLIAKHFAKYTWQLTENEHKQLRLNLVLSKQFVPFTWQITENEYKQPILNLILSHEAIKSISTKAIAEVKQILVDRVNELAITGAKVKQQDENRLEVWLPGVQDIMTAKQLLAKKIRFEFLLQAKESTPASSQDELEFNGGIVRLDHSVMITEQHIKNIKPSSKNKYTHQIDIELDRQGSKLMSQMTSNNIWRSMAVVLIKQTPQVSYMKTAKDKQIIKLSNVEDKKILILAVIRDTLSNHIAVSLPNDTPEGEQLTTLWGVDKLLATMYFIEGSSAK